MAARMIPVRHRETGQTTRVSEKAYGLFAAYYERLDQPAPTPAETTVEEPPAVPAEPASDDHPTGRRAAKTSEKE